MLRFLGKLLFSKHWRKDRPSENTSSAPAPNVRGFKGDLNVKAALMVDQPNLVLSVDYNFPDMPSYVEFDLGKRHIHIVQQGGDVATLAQLALPRDEYDTFMPLSRIALLTGSGDEKLVQMLSLIIKQPAAPSGYSF